MRTDGARARFGRAEAVDDQRLAGAQRLFGHAPKSRDVLDVLDQHQDHVGLAFIDDVFGKIARREAGFIAGGHDVAERQILRPPVIEERKAHAAALRDHGDLPASTIRRQQRHVAGVHRGAEGWAQRGGRVGEALAVRAAHRHVVFPGDGLNLFLQRRPRLAFLLGEAGRQDDRRLDASRPAALQLLRHDLGRNDQCGEVGRRKIADAVVRLEPLHLRLAAAHRVDRALIGMTLHDLHDAPAQTARVGRRANDRDRFRPKQFLDIGHSAQT